MAKSSGPKRGRALSRLAVAAIAAALVGATAGSAVADTPAPAPLKSVDQDGFSQAVPQNGTLAAGAAAPVHALFAMDKYGDLYAYGPNGRGGLTAREYVTSGWDVFRGSAQADHDGDGSADGVYSWDKQGYLYYSSEAEPLTLGRGWDAYDKIVVAGNLGGTTPADVLARDKAGVLWFYKGKADGTLSARTKVGSGWQAFNQILGQGDLSGDGRADVVTRDKSGVLWLYKGTGNAAAPFAKGTKVGGGWGAFNYLVSTGDLTMDGRTDLIARDSAGALWRYNGTGNAAAPFAKPTKIGTSGWNGYTLMF
ncbi:FG-GAP repeat domain-containing protein [Streptomyces sp. NPDC093546]|uniref:FG-GAP repeat domain-containing protein n=1 Tax=Streptomyces sp. NPDC093546 TaxID=3366040 RepID=UPI00382144DC